MKNLWNNRIAKKYRNNSLAMRVYSTRLLGQEEDLVLHGGGNTSIKLKEKNIFGEEEILYVKGSGWDLATIEEAGFSPIKRQALLKMVELEKLSDKDMVKYQRASMTNPFSPNPSIEAILHAIIPTTFVDHTHADAVVTLTNTVNGKQRLKEIYGDKILIIPYVMPGFVLAKEIHKRTKNVDWKSIKGMILMNHGVFTFDNQAKTSYENMISIVSKAEAYLKKKGASASRGKTHGRLDLKEIAQIRKQVSKKWGEPILAQINNAPDHAAFSNHPNIEAIVNRGPITPDHVIRTKRIPVVLNGKSEKSIDHFEKIYKKAFQKFNDGTLVCLDPAPRWAVWKDHGTISFGRTLKDVKIISDISRHTIRAIQQAEMLGGWHPLSERDYFDIEYWELEQAKLKKASKPPLFHGKIALVTGAANGIGKACVECLLKEGAVVTALDINSKIKTLFGSQSVLGLPCDVTNQTELKQAIDKTVKQFGGIDFLVSNAGIFPQSMPIEKMNQDIWNKSMDINLRSHQVLINLCIPFMQFGIDPAIVIVGSKNVPAPGPGASAYSVAKAGLTQLARIAALELGKKGIRVNIVHPNAVYDTAIWTEDVLKARAKNYGLSVPDYKTNNLLGVEITSKEVAALVVTMLGPVFSKITGAQIPIDGGNERVI